MTTKTTTCHQCCGTGWGHPDDMTARCLNCTGTGEVLDTDPSEYEYVLECIRYGGLPPA